MHRIGLPTIAQESVEAMAFSIGNGLNAVHQGTLLLLFPRHTHTQNTLALMC